MLQEAELLPAEGALSFTLSYGMGFSAPGEGEVWGPREPSLACFLLISPRTEVGINQF